MAVVRPGRHREWLFLPRVWVDRRRGAAPTLGSDVDGTLEAARRSFVDAVSNEDAYAAGLPYESRPA